MTDLLIIRGVPGSGKTTFARKLRDEHGIPYYEADQFFERLGGGRYAFDPGLLAEAHQWCREQVKASLASGKTTAVSNTFTRVWEMLPHKRMADQLANRLIIYEMTGNYGSVHGVPDGAIQKMLDRWEEIPADWGADVRRGNAGDVEWQ